MTNKTWLWWLLAALWCGGVLVVTSDPTSFFDGFVVAGVGALLSLAWLIRLIVVVRGTERRPRLIFLGMEAFFCCMVAAFCQVGGAEQARFIISVPSLTGYVKSGQLSEKPVVVGLYRFRRVKKEGDQVSFELGNAFLDSVGFVYCPKLAPISEGRSISYEPLQGPWYKWTAFWD